MTNKDELINGFKSLKTVMAEKVDKKQKIILDKWTWIVLVCTIIIILLKVFG